MRNFKLYIKALLFSLFSRSFYYDLIVSYKIYGLIYVFFLSFIISLPISHQVKSSFNNFIGVTSDASIDEINDNIDYIADQIPDLAIKNNKMSIASGDDTIVVVSKSNKPVFVIDTNDSIQDLTGYENTILLGSDKFILSFNEASVAISLADVMSDLAKYLSKKDGYTEFSFRDLFLDMRGLFIFPAFAFVIVSALWFFMRYSFKVVAFSFVAGFLMNLMLKGRVFTYRAFLRVSSFAITPIFLMEFMSYNFGVVIFSRPELVYLVTHLFYIYFAIESYKKMSFKDVK